MTDRPKLLVTRRLPEAVEARLKETFDVSLNAADAPLDAASIAQALTRYDALCPTITDRIGSDALAAAGVRTRIIANFGAGVEHIDLDAAVKTGIVVTNTPDALTDSTADLAMLLILMTTRRAGEGERELRAGLWTGWRPTHMLGRSLSGKTLGLIGFGRIAQATAARAGAFGMRILYHSRNQAAPALEARFNARRAPSLEALAAAADIVSLHVPGGAGTRHLVNRLLLERMKPSAVLINTARGSVIDEAALADALRRRTIAAAGLDVFEREPAVHPDLVTLDNAVLLPHLGSATIETRTAMGMQAADNLESFFAGRAPPNRVN